MGENEPLLICCKYLAEYKKSPSTTELQGFAKKIGKTISFSQATPVITDFLTKLLSAFNGLTVEATDNRDEKVNGALRGATEKSKRWQIEVHEEAKKYLFTVDKIPDIAVS